MLTQEELERRRGFITASEMPAIMGAYPPEWSNAATVFTQKTMPMAAWKGNDATDAGNMLEPAVLEWARSKLGPLVGGGWHVHEGGILAATLDEKTASGEPVEAKTSGIVGPGMPYEWGEEGTDKIPDYYVIQVQAELLVTGAAKAWVPALIGNRGFVMYQVKANEDLQGIILAEAQAFWTNHVSANVPPDNYRPNLDVLKRIIRVKGKSTSVSDELAQEFLQAQKNAKYWDAEEKLAKSALLAAIGDAESATWSGGEFTYREQTNKSHIVEESTFRVLRVKKAKEEKCLTAN